MSTARIVKGKDGKYRFRRRLVVMIMDGVWAYKRSGRLVTFN